jgi:hypothetical protein
MVGFNDDRERVQIGAVSRDSIDGGKGPTGRERWDGNFGFFLPRSRQIKPVER